MKNARPIEMETSAPEQCANSTTQQTQAPRKFAGTSNPRELRALYALLQCKEMPRLELAKVTGSVNVPDLIMKLRGRGLEIRCRQIDVLDRDGRPCRPGIYFLTDTDRRAIRQWQTRLGGAQ